MVECYREGGEVGLSISERGGELRLGVHDTATKVERRKLKRMDGTTASSHCHQTLLRLVARNIDLRVLSAQSPDFG